ncbi:hypothetical protein UR09_06680 [Candidatus Nitromaritima sp. SCGC AAA799-A02]|nr:hypothetical protein UR09_06680 [Candidatus Nitromaritima sp. SCGC AAA799-A02]
MPAKTSIGFGKKTYADLVVLKKFPDFLFVFPALGHEPAATTCLDQDFGGICKREKSVCGKDRGFEGMTLLPCAFHRVMSRYGGRGSAAGANQLEIFYQ